MLQLRLGPGSIDLACKVVTQGPRTLHSLLVLDIRFGKIKRGLCCVGTVFQRVQDQSVHFNFHLKQFDKYT